MTTETDPSDEQLVRRAANGDEPAFTLLYRRRQAGIFRFALHMTGSRTLAEEITQEVFFALVRRLPGYDPQRGSVAPFLYGIARNHVLRALDRDGPYVGLAEDAEELVGGEGSPEEQLLSRQAVNSVHQAVLSLPPLYREAVVLCELQELTYQDAANTIGVPVGTVRSRLNRGRALLAEKLRGLAANCSA